MDRPKNPLPASHTHHALGASALVRKSHSSEATGMPSDTINLSAPLLINQPLIQ
ncbi:hypothetical protein FA13DRAFT_1738415 [Coprinellus micaceus]|uniref:Uncharacterized protein n=1 Tax=Coprinellus micaceus TaxID=71717 RepID=A0A4Y7STX5_COPMI|nr:hypothetical protein FA13DRAFT_1738415 [Coprinellus micaceus]